MVCAETQDARTWSEQVDLTFADVRKLCDEQVVVRRGTCSDVNENGIYIAVPTRVGVEGPRVDVVGFVAGCVHDEDVVGCGEPQGLTDAFGIRTDVFTEAHVDNGCALIHGIANGVGDVFVNLIAIRHHAHWNDVDQAVSDSDRAAFSRGPAADDAGDVRAVVLVSSAGVVVAVPDVGFVRVARVVIWVGPVVVVVPSFLHRTLEVPEREVFRHHEFQKLSFRTFQPDGAAVKPDLFKVVRVFLEGVEKGGCIFEVDSGIEPRVVCRFLGLLGDLSRQVHVEVLQPRGHR